MAGADRGGEHAALNHERSSRIEAALATLSPELREVFLMREILDMGFAEIAEAVGAPEPTVKSRMRYALEKLRKILIELRDSGRYPVVDAPVGGAR